MATNFLRLQTLQHLEGRTENDDSSVSSSPPPSSLAPTDPPSSSPPSSAPPSFPPPAVPPKPSALLVGTSSSSAPELPSSSSSTTTENAELDELAGPLPTVAKKARSSSRASADSESISTINPKRISRSVTGNRETSSVDVDNDDEDEGDSDDHHLESTDSSSEAGKQAAEVSKLSLSTPPPSIATVPRSDSTPSSPREGRPHSQSVLAPRKPTFESIFLSPREASAVPEPVWIQEGNRRILQAATLKQAIACYVENTPDSLTLRHLVLAHANFVSSSAFMDQLVKAFVRASAEAPPLKVQYQLRIVNIIKTWVDLSYQTLQAEPTTNSIFSAFMDDLRKSHPNIVGHLTGAMEAFSNKRQATCHHLLGADNVDEDSLPHHPAPPPTMALKHSPAAGEKPKFIDFHPLEIARQLCLIDHKYLFDIPLTELHSKKWTTNQAPFISTATAFANKLSYWLADQILAETKTKQQLKVFNHIVLVGKYLLELQNFNSLFAVYLSLNLKSVKQLRVDWAKLLPKRTLSTLKRIEAINSPLDNFGGYRGCVRHLRPPMIPCQDLLYQYEVTPDFIDGSVNVINMQKMDAMGRIIYHISTCQLAKYCLRRDAALQSLLGAIANMDKGDFVSRTIHSRPNVSTGTPVRSPATSARSSPATPQRKTPPADPGLSTYTSYSLDASSESSQAPPEELPEKERRARTLPGTKVPIGSDDELSTSDTARSDDESKGITGAIRDFLNISPRKKPKRSSEHSLPNRLRGRDKKQVSRWRSEGNVGAPEAAQVKSPAAPVRSVASAVDVAASRSGRPESPPPAAAPDTQHFSAPPSPAMSPRVTPRPSPRVLALVAPDAWIVIRKFEKRGGVKVRVPATIEELLRLGETELGVQAVCAREAATEGLLKSVAAIQDGAIVWLMTAEEEALFD